MNKIIPISTLISTDIRSRANANIIRSAIDGITDNITLDFSNVSFMSRSFTDELYNVMEEHKNITFINMSPFVTSMWDAVIQGRKTKRVSSTDTSEIKEFKDMKSLESFLATI